MSKKNKPETEAVSPAPSGDVHVAADFKIGHGKAAEPAQPAIEVVDATAPSGYYRVERLAKYVLASVIHTLEAGQVIDAAQYDVVEMRKQGVPLVEITAEAFSAAAGPRNWTV